MIVVVIFKQQEFDTATKTILLGKKQHDNLFRTEHAKVTLRFTVLDLTNKVALYNFQSTFSGTHFVAPRSYQGQVGLTF
ncbi:MAG: hypothetical protein M3R52_09175 [Acidobacteriota bacterium]|nr:hypothetical protein [Acidobacteriota bacterium]